MSRSEALGQLVAFVLIIAVLMVGLVGYVMNIIKLLSAEVGGEMIVRAIGIFVAPLGMFAGYF